MTPADLKAKAQELVGEVVRSAESAYMEQPAPYADKYAAEARADLTAFVDALIECAIELKGVVAVDTLLAPAFDATRYAEAHKTHQRRKAIVARLEELTK